MNTRNNPRPTHIAIAPLLALILSGCASGGATSYRSPVYAQRVAVQSIPRNDRPGMAWKTGNLFGAVQPQDPAHYYNIFRFGGGHVVALALRAESDNGRYAGDSLTVMDLTNTSDIQGWHHEIGRYESNSLNNGFRYSLSFRPTGSDTIARLTDNYGIIAEVSINTLYRLRVKDPVNTQVYIGEREFYQGAQGGPRGGSLFYSARTYEMADDPTANAGDLTPTYVVFVNKRVGVSNVHLGDAPLGDSGYVLHYDDADGSLEVKKAD